MYVDGVFVENLSSTRSDDKGAQTVGLPKWSRNTQAFFLAFDILSFTLILTCRRSIITDKMPSFTQSSRACDARALIVISCPRCFARVRSKRSELPTPLHAVDPALGDSADTHTARMLGLMDMPFRPLKVLRSLSKTDPLPAKSRDLADYYRKALSTPVVRSTASHWEHVSAYNDQLHYSRTATNSR